MLRTASLIAFVLLAAAGCKSKKSDGGAAASGGAAPSGNDWSKVPLETVELSADGVTYSISVPKGLPKSGGDPKSWSNDKPEHDQDPKVFTSLGSNVTTLDSALSDAMFDAEKVAKLARKEERPTGYAFTDVAGDKHRVEARTLTRAGDKMIKCTATQVTEGALPSFEATKAMLEKICDSVKPK